MSVSLQRTIPGPDTHSKEPCQKTVPKPTPATSQVANSPLPHYNRLPVPSGNTAPTKISTIIIPAPRLGTGAGPDPDIVSEVESEVVMKKLKGKAKASNVDLSEESVMEGIEEEEDEASEDEASEEDERSHFVVKDEKVRHKPQKGRLVNTLACIRCAKKDQVCYMQDSLKARGACYDCGRLKIKCLYSVSGFLCKFKINDCL